MFEGLITEETGYGLGDVNQDTTINVLDIVAMVTLILTGQHGTIASAYADYNQDGTANILDIVAVVDYIMENYGGGNT